MYYVPEGYEEVEVPTCSRETFAEFIEDWYGIKSVKHGTKLALASEHKYGYTQLNAAGDVLKVIDRTNPNAKWDWYEVGGRYKNKLLLKNGTHASAARLDDIDFVGMRAHFKAKALEYHRNVTAIIAGRAILPWAHFYKKVEAKTLPIDTARNEYYSQEVLKELTRAKVLENWNGDADLAEILASDAKTYAQHKGMLNASTWALVHNGEWFERGSMGWFGMSDSTPESEMRALEKYWHTIETLPGDTPLTVVDCHI